MSMLYTLAILVFSPLFVALVATPCVGIAALKGNLVDKPDNNRKLHTRAVPRVGGVAIFIAYTFAIGLLFASSAGRATVTDARFAAIESVIPSLAIVWMTGLLDDVRGLCAYHKLLGVCIAAALFVRNSTHVQILPFSHSVSSWIQGLLAVIWIVVCTNAFNLIDGADGLAAGVGLVIGVVDVTAAFLFHSYGMAFAALPLVAALLGFLPFNFSPASIFLGDSGSLMIGFILGCCSIFWSREIPGGIEAIAPALALTIPLVDTAVAVTRRFLRRQSIFSPDHSHIHHKLLARGFTHRRVAVTMYLAAAFYGILSILDSVMGPPMGWLSLILACGAIWFGIRQLRYQEFELAHRMIVRGGFRQGLNVELQLSSLRDTLSSARTPDECWAVVRNTYHLFGFDTVELGFQEHLYFDSRTQWGPGPIILRVELAGNGFLNLYSESGSEHPAAVIRFVCVIHEVLSKNVGEYTMAPSLAVRNGSLSGVPAVQTAIECVGKPW